jgi:hypothetical protein
LRYTGFVIIIDLLAIVLIVLIFIFFMGAGLLGAVLFPYVLAFGAGYLVIRILSLIFRKSPLNEFTKIDVFKTIFIAAIVYILIDYNSMMLLNGVFTAFWLVLLCYLLSCLFFWLIKGIFPKIWVILAVILLIVFAIFAGYMKNVRQAGGPEITIDELENAEYLVSMPKYNKIIKLKGGFSNSSDAGVVSISTPYVAYGDLNDDGKTDAALFLRVNGSNNLVVMLNKDGKPSYLTQKYLGSDYGNRGAYNFQPQALTISSGIITATILYVDTDSKKVFKYKLSGDHLVEAQ